MTKLINRTQIYLYSSKPKVVKLETTINKEEYLHNNW